MSPFFADWTVFAYSSFSDLKTFAVPDAVSRGLGRPSGQSRKMSKRRCVAGSVGQRLGSEGATTDLVARDIRVSPALQHVHELKEKVRRLEVAESRAKEDIAWYHDAHGGVESVGAPAPGSKHDILAESAQSLECSVHSLRAKLDQASARLRAARDELCSAVNAPASNGHDATATLPDELLFIIFLQLPLPQLGDGRCALVCRRWCTLMASRPIRQHIQHRRWEMYEAGLMKPRTLQGHSNDVTALAVAPDGSLYSGSVDCTVLQWRRGAVVRLLTGHTKAITAIAVAPDNVIVCTASWDTTVLVWRAADGRRLRALCGHTGVVWAVVIDPDHRIYSGSMDKSIRVWCGTSGECLQTLWGHADWVRALAIGPRGTLYSGSYDKRIITWSRSEENGEELCIADEYGGHSGFVEALTMSEDEGKVVSGSADGSVCVWSQPEGALLGMLVGHSHSVKSVVCHGKHLFSASRDGVVCMWTGLPTPFSEEPTARITTPSVVNALVVSQDVLFCGSGSDILQY